MNALGKPIYAGSSSLLTEGTYGEIIAIGEAYAHD